jgi:class 3 adenylate cyclase
VGSSGVQALKRRGGSSLQGPVPMDLDRRPRRHARTALVRHRGREVKAIGDGFLATFDVTTRAVRAGTEIVAGARGMGLEVRAGVHTGEALRCGPTMCSA